MGGVQHLNCDRRWLCCAASPPFPDAGPPACVCLCLCVSPPPTQLALCVLDEVCISYILARVLGGLAYLHDAGRLHRCVVYGS